MRAEILAKNKQRKQLEINELKDTKLGRSIGGPFKKFNASFSSCWYSDRGFRGE